MQPHAITGVGVVSPIAIGYHNFVAALAKGCESSTDIAFAGPSTALPLDQEAFANSATAEVRNFDANSFLGEKGHRNFDRLTRYLIVAAKLALEDAGLKKDGAFTSLKPEQIGVCSATAYGSLDSITELNLVAELEDPRYINPARFPNTVINAAAGYVSIWEDLRAPNATIVNGNCGAIDALLAAETHLAHKRADCFLVGGGDVVSEPLYVAFDKLGALAPSRKRWNPGGEVSEGLLLGEGAAYVVVERASEAAQRGARVRALAVGYGTAFEPPTHEALLLNPSPVAVARAIRLALDDAGIAAKSVDAVVASCAGLSRYDAAELHGIEQVLGTSVPVLMPKQLWGEAFAGGQAMATAASIAWLEGKAPLPDFESVKTPKTIVQIAVGYYGNVSAMALRAV